MNLLKAVQSGNVEEVERLLQQQELRFEINSLRSGGVSPLMVASRIRDARKCERMMELLLGKGADVNLEDQNGWTALMKAVHDKRRDVVKFLLTKKPELELRNNDSATALMIACRQGDLEIVKLLLKSGAQVNNMKQEPQYIKYGQDHHYYYDRSPLVIAVDNSHFEIVQQLLSYGAQICIERCDALVSACQKQDVEMAKCLLENKTVQVNSINSGSTPLIAACRNNLTSIVKQLLEHGAKVGVQDRDGTTALMRAVMAHNVEIILLLLAHCSLEEVNLCEKYDGNTALMIAVKAVRDQKDVTIVKMLLEKGANPNMKNKRGRTSLFAALSNYNYKSKDDFSLLNDIVLLLLDKYGEINYDNEVRFPIFGETFEVCKLLIEKGVDFGRLLSSGRETSLHVFSNAQQTELVRLYLDKMGSSDINESDSKGCTPIWYAVYCSNYEIFGCVVQTLSCVHSTEHHQHWRC